MTFPRARLLGAVALFAVRAGAAAQTRTPTIFSRASQVGTVNIRAAIVLDDYTVKPLPLVPVVARANGRADSVAGTTNLEGRLSLKLPAGAYTIRARTPQPVAGRSYLWAVDVVVRATQSHAVELTNANATIERATIAAAPQPTPAARPPAPAPDVVERPANAPPAQPSARERAQDADSAARPATPRLTPQPTARARGLEPAPARSNTSKLFLGLGLNGSSVRADDLGSSTESGGGLSALVGWGFTKNFALFLDASAARITTDDGDFDLGHFDLGARWHFASPSRALTPFLEVAYSGRAAMESDVMLMDDMGNTYQGDLSIAGTGISFGGGLQYFVAPTWALGGSLKWTKGEFSRVQFDNVSVDGFEMDATSARFELGFTWYPMRGAESDGQRRR